MSNLSSAIAVFLTTGDAIARRSAENTISTVLRSKDGCILPFLEIIVLSPDGGCRQLAAVLLRRRLATQFTKTLQAEQQQSVKQALLDRAWSESVPGVRRALVALIGALGTVLCPAGHWPELLPWLSSASEDPTAERREIAMLTIYSIAGCIFRVVSGPAIVSLASSVHTHLNAPDKTVSRAAVFAAAGLLSNVEKEVQLAPLIALLDPLFNGTCAALCVAVPQPGADDLCVGVEAVRGPNFHSMEPDIDVAMDAIEAMEDVMISAGSKAARAVVPRMIGLFAALARCTDVPAVVRCRVISLLVDVLTGPGSRKLLKGPTRAPLVDCLVRTAIAMLREPDETSTTLECAVDRVHASMPAVGSEFLEALASIVPIGRRGTPTESRVLGTVLAGCQSTFQVGSTASPQDVVAAILAIAAISGPCHSALAGGSGWIDAGGSSDTVEIIAGWCIAAIRTRVPEVVGATCLAIAELAASLAPRFFDHAGALLSNLSAVLAETVVVDRAAENIAVVRAVQCRVLYAVEMLVDDLDGKVASGVVGDLHAPLCHIAAGSGPNDPAPERRFAMAALGALVKAADSSVTPFAQPILQVAQAAMTSTDDLLLPLRSRAIELIGVIFRVVGSDAFAQLVGCEASQVIPQLLEMLYTVLQDDDPELRENAHRCMTNIAETLEGDFAVLLPTYLPMVVSSLNLQIGGLGEGGHDPLAGPNIGLSDDDDSDADSDDSDAAFGKNFYISKPIVEEKKAALVSARVFCRVCRPVISRQPAELEVVLDALHEPIMNCIQAPLDSLKSEAFLTLSQLTLLACRIPRNGLFPPGLFDPPESENSTKNVAAFQFATGDQGKQYWTVGKPTSDDYDSQQRNFLDDVVEIYTTVLQEEFEPKVVDAALSALLELLVMIGPLAVANYISGIIEALFNFYSGKANCIVAAPPGVEQGEDSDEDEDDEATTQHKVTLMFEHVLDLTEALAKAYGADFSPAWKVLFPAFRKLLSPSHPNVVGALGTLAAVAKALGDAPGTTGEEMFESHLGLFMSAVGAGPPAGGPASRPAMILRNGVYGLGLIAQGCPRLIVPHLTKVVPAITAILDHSAVDVVDNCAAALMRIILACHSVIGADSATLFGMSLRVLPPREDWSDIVDIFGVVELCLKGGIPSIQPLDYIGEIVRVVSAALVDPRLPARAQGPVTAALQQFSLRHGAAMSTACSVIPVDHQTKLRAFIFFT